VPEKALITPHGSTVGAPGAVGDGDDVGELGDDGVEDDPPPPPQPARRSAASAGAVSATNCERAVVSLFNRSTFLM
jgi:hypothetical protein